MFRICSADLGLSHVLSLIVNTVGDAVSRSSSIKVVDVGTIHNRGVSSNINQCSSSWGSRPIWVSGASSQLQLQESLHHKQNIAQSKSTEI